MELKNGSLIHSVTDQISPYLGILEGQRERTLENSRRATDESEGTSFQNPVGNRSSLI